MKTNVRNISLEDTLNKTSESTGLSSISLFSIALSVLKNLVIGGIREKGKSSILTKKIFEEDLRVKIDEIKNENYQVSQIILKGISSDLIKRYNNLYSEVVPKTEGFAVRGYKEKRAGAAIAKGHHKRVGAVRAKNQAVKPIRMYGGFFNEVAADTPNFLAGAVSDMGLIIVRSIGNKFYVHAENKARLSIQAGSAKIGDLLNYDPPFPVEPKPKDEMVVFTGKMAIAIGDEMKIIQTRKPTRTKGVRADRTNKKK